MGKFQLPYMWHEVLQDTPTLHQGIIVLPLYNGPTPRVHIGGTNTLHVGKNGPPLRGANFPLFWHQFLSDKIGTICGKYNIFPIDLTKHVSLDAVKAFLSIFNSILLRQFKGDT